MSELSDVVVDSSSPLSERGEFVFKSKFARQMQVTIKSSRAFSAPPCGIAKMLK